MGKLYLYLVIISPRTVVLAIFFYCFVRFKNVYDDDDDDE